MSTKPTQTALTSIPEPKLYELVVSLLERMEKAESHIRAIEAINDQVMDWLTDLDKKVCNTPSNGAEVSE